MELYIKEFNLNFNGLSKEKLLDGLKENKLQVIFPVNSELIVMANENEKFKNVLNKYITTIDGQIPFFIIKLKNRDVYLEKISGSEFIYDVCNVANELGLKVFLLGGLEESNKLSQKKLKEKFPNLHMDGFSPPYSPYPFPNELNERILEYLKKSSPDILFVAFGAPKQEFWINDNIKELKELGIRFIMSVGGTFEIVSGREKPAPLLIKKLGFESVWRLLQNPKRINRFFRNFKIFKYI